MEYRTDLAIEKIDAEKATGGEGVEITKWREENVYVTEIQIKDHRGEEQIGKPMGKYVTVEIQGQDHKGNFIEEEKDRACATRVLTKVLKEMIPFNSKLKALVVGLGNRRVTPDSIGPLTAENINATRHLFQMFDCQEDEDMANVSCLIPGVTGNTGMETADLIKKAMEITSPDVTIAIDALAARNIDRINTTIQITDTGISPGSGMGNHRKALNSKTMGGPVIAIGVPTVIDSKTLIIDAMDQGKWPAAQVEKYLQEKDLDMIVTSTDIDQAIEDFSIIISNAVNNILHPGIYS